jgi:hypothetical protein
MAEKLEDLAGVTAADLVVRLLGELEGNALLASAPDIANAFAVSRVAKWLDRAVLRPLDALIDAPHFVERWPFLIEPGQGDMSDPHFWRSLRGKEGEFLSAKTPPGARLAIADRLIGKEVYVLARVVDDDALHKLSDAFDFSASADVVFAEDTSRFVLRETATEFRAGFSNFNDRRFIEKLPDKTYGPQRRFAFGD